MLLVVDANIIFSSMIKDGTTAGLLVSENLKLITPEFVLSELWKHKDEILAMTHRSHEDFVKFLLIVETKVEVIPNSKIIPFLERARTILPTHQKDAPYLALAIRYDCPIWSGDKKLKRQNEVEVIDYRQSLDHDIDKALKFLRAAVESGVYFHDYGGRPAHHGFSAAHTIADMDRALEGIEAAMQTLT